jgi:hypothetical protein
MATKVKGKLKKKGMRGGGMLEMSEPHEAPVHSMVRMPMKTGGDGKKGKMNPSKVKRPPGMLRRKKSKR